MIVGRFSDQGEILRPFVRGRLTIPGHEQASQQIIEFLVDTGADTTLLSPVDADALGLDTSALAIEAESSGVGGEVALRVVEAVLTIQGYSVPLILYIPEGEQVIPSLLGRDFMAGFALFMEESTRTLVLLDKAEVANLGLRF